MTWFADLSPCEYFGASGAVLAVGWLERGHDFPRGETPRDVYDRLCALFVEPFQPVVFPGSHTCNLCQFDGHEGHSNLFVPGDGSLFAAPQLLLHYIGAHFYAPPPAFQRAVLACPDTSTLAYKQAFLQSGGRALLLALKAQRRQHDDESPR